MIRRLQSKPSKIFFKILLAERLNLLRVSAPLFVTPESGLNDNLNGVERPVSFGIKDQGEAQAEIVHSLAKWKRYALQKYGFSVGEGLYTDMSAIRRDEETDNIHSIYVDQWDWEKIITKEMRTLDTLKDTVRNVYKVLRKTENTWPSVMIISKKSCPMTFSSLPQANWKKCSRTAPQKKENITFPKKKEPYALCRLAICWHRAKSMTAAPPDYDDWALNADIIVYYPVLDIALELSSMGIRVDKEALLSQLEKAGCPERAELPFQKAVISEELPYTIGGGIGQSRICMFFLRKAHIGEVQCSLWPENVMEEARKARLPLL